MKGIDELIRGLGGVAIPLGAVSVEKSEPDDGRCALPRDVQALRLREYAARYRAPNPFVPGDLVTVRKEAPYRGAGDVFVVVDVFEPIRRFDGPPTNDDYSRIYSMRVARLWDNGDREAILGWAAHHVDYEAITVDDAAL